MRDRQQEFDWSRGRQLAILRDCVFSGRLVGHDGRRVAQSTAKLILQQIDHFGRGHTCWVGVARLAQTSGVTPRTVIRSIQALTELGLLIVERDGVRRSNRYTIVWSELALLCPENFARPSTSLRPSGSPVTQGRRHQSAEGEDSRGTDFSRTATVGNVSTEQSDTRTEQSDTRTEQSDTRTEQSDTGVTLTVPRSAKEPPPPTPSDEPCHWGTAAAELRAFGLQRVMAAIQFAKDRGLTPPEVLDAIQVAKANARLFARPAAALYVWLQSSEWPADGVRDCRTLQAERERQTDAKRQARLQDAVHHAWLEVRRKTPPGTVVDDRQVVDVAVAMGVPRETAMAERGLVLVSEL